MDQKRTTSGRAAESVSSDRKGHPERKAKPEPPEPPALPEQPGPKDRPEQAGQLSSFGADGAPAEYRFTGQERAYFARLQAQIQQQLGASIALICSQNALDGQWQVSPDGNGLIKVG